MVHRGVVTAADLLAADVSQDEIDWRRRRKRLIPVWRGVYFVGHPDPAEHAYEYAALKLGGPESGLFYRTAAVMWGLLPPQVDPTIHIALSEKRADRKGLKFHQVNLAPSERRTIHGDLRITTPARTLLDNADHANLEQMVADAIRRRLTTREELALLLESHKGERNTANLRRVLDQGPLWTASEFERRFVDLIRRAQLPLPESNLRTGNTIPDLIWRDRRVLVELDSRWAHNDWIAGRRDRTKDRTRTLAGWTCLRYTPEDLRDRPFHVIAEIAAALALRG